MPIIKEIQPTSVNIIDLRNYIWMKNNHIIYFINTNKNPVHKIGNGLINKKICQKPKNFKRIVGHVLIQSKILDIIIKETTSNEIFERNVVKRFKQFKNEIKRLNILNANISQYKSDIKIPWNRIRNIIQLTFLHSPVCITICQGRICIPKPKDRLRIIQECHESSVGGHKGITKTVARICHKYYWENLKLQVEKFIQTCNSCQKKN